MKKKLYKEITQTILSGFSSVGRAFDCSGFHIYQIVTGSIPVIRIPFYYCFIQ
jgi:hypothetical protein